jgi:putative transposase
MQVSPSAYYAWLKRPAKLITGEELHLHRRAKALFIESRESLGSESDISLHFFRKEGTGLF